MLGQQRDGPGGHGHRARGAARKAVAQHERQTRAQERQSEAGHDLVGLEMDAHDRVDGGQGGARDHRREQAQPRVARVHAHLVAREGTHEQDALDAQVDDPGALGEDLAEGREQEDGARGDPCGEDELEVHRRTTRTRNRTRMSLQMTQNSRMPWIIVGMPAGWISRPASDERPERDGREHDAEGVEPRQVGDDHAREAIARRKAVLEPVATPLTSDMPAEARQATRHEHHQDDRPPDVDARVPGRPGVVPDEADLVAQPRP